ncbi:uncharacterized protein KGF55_004034 [Candida pseudojiufengensis]|uniref:uncharacterized protein n=1 Tax=Candida pseudojiufengensis TaxID=497109 RepID=UPI00222485EF|nr:uncharacterized protein KGF55_004034 [Candida pseudojiufengensis]KAI5961411.1 hypothetical protein KGF55_004034 [Candida pseudojiufengensis]
MARLLSRIFRGITHNKNKEDQKCKNSLPFDKIPQIFDDSIGDGDISRLEQKLTDEETLQNFNHSDVFGAISNDAVVFIIKMYDLIEDLNTLQVSEKSEEVKLNYRTEFDERFKIILNNLIYVKENDFQKSELEIIKFLFQELKNSRNVILLSNKLKPIENINNDLKTSIFQYFKEIWCFEISTSINDEFMIDLYSISLKIWEMKIISLVVSQQE